MNPTRLAHLKFVLLAVAMIVLWHLAASSLPSEEEQALAERVRAAQKHVAAWRTANGTNATHEHDPGGCGLIGVEWSALTTTLGSLEAKRTACDPLWAIRFHRWYEKAGLVAGDTVAIYSSASFPGLLLSAVAAAEAYGLEPLLVVSLGASSWGANRLDLPWPVLGLELRRAGFLATRADYYTLGGGSETGGGMAPETVEDLRSAARAAGVPLLRAVTLEEVIIQKTELLERRGARLLISIGGSQANLGNDPEILGLSPGFHVPGERSPAGDGVIGAALSDGIPVVHVLNVRELAARSGIAFDPRVQAKAPLRVKPVWALLALSLFFGVLLTHRRWRLV
ncbi:MAG: poly-gamma-glutamate system protein [Gammaproteobacteria bacterium]|nr:poly-gamma-glutamate system protein [Gammaproteobacteria bacterium]